MSTDVEAPTIPGIVAGVRTWRVANTMWARMGGWLWSWGALACWRPPDIEEWKEAECDMGHEVPGTGCHCGIYAWNSPRDMRIEMPHGPQRARSFEHVSGVIGATGVIWEHVDKRPNEPEGFRCQKAKVLALFDAESTQERPMEKIAAQYNVPIITEDDYDAFCEQHKLFRFDWQD